MQKNVEEILRRKEMEREDKKWGKWDILKNLSRMRRNEVKRKKITKVRWKILKNVGEILKKEMERKSNKGRKRET